MTAFAPDHTVTLVIGIVIGATLVGGLFCAAGGQRDWAAGLMVSAAIFFALQTIHQYGYRALFFHTDDLIAIKRSAQQAHVNRGYSTQRKAVE